MAKGVGWSKKATIDGFESEIETSAREIEREGVWKVERGING